MNERDIFIEAIEKASPAERKAFLDGACREDSALRARVEALIAKHLQEDSFFLDSPAVNEKATVDLPSQDLERPGHQIGPYKLREVVGEGGFGVVYVAEQTQPVRRKVALKIIKPGMDSREVVARFEAERQALALMDHPNVARVLDAGTTDSGRPYFVMELVHGVPITEFCDKNHLPTSERLRLFVSVCRAVQHAHQKGIIHRDLKPSNIMVTLHDGQPVSKVIDFGVAKALSQQLTEKTIYTSYGQVIGTPQYMSPEQAEMSGLGIDTRSDIYSLGVLLYELLTGKPPVDRQRLLASGYAEMMRIIREEEAVRPSRRVSTMGEEATVIAQHRRTDKKKLTRNLRGELDWIVMKALDKDRERRYETANGLADDIGRLLNNEAVSACPPSTGYRVRKFLRRNPAVLAGSATAGLMLMFAAGMLVSLYYQGSLRLANDRLQSTNAELDSRNVALTEVNSELDRTAQHLQKSRDDLDRVLYFRRVSQALTAWNDNEAARAENLLSDCPSVLRDWEWYYVHSQMNSGVTTLVGHSGWVTCLAFSPDGRRIVSGGGTRREGHELKLWELANPQAFRDFEGIRDWTATVAFSSGGDRIVTGCGDGTAQIWETATGIALVRIDAHETAVRTATLSPDASKLVTASSHLKGGDPVLKLWDAQTGRLLYNLTGHTGFVHCATFSPSGRRIASGSRDDTIRVWNVETGEQEVKIDKHDGDIWSITFSPDGTRIISSSEDKTTKIWDTETGSLLQVADGTTAAFSRDGHWLVSTLDRSVFLWDAENGRKVFTLNGHVGDVEGALFTPGGERVVSWGRDNTLKIWNTTTGREVRTLRGHKDRISGVSIPSDGQRIASASRDGTIRVWDNTGRFDDRVMIGNAEKVPGRFGQPTVRVAVSTDDQRVASVMQNDRITLWDVATGGKIISLKGHRDDVVSAVAFTPDGRRLVSGSWSSELKLWGLEGSKELTSLPGNEQGIRCVAVSPDGKFIASSGDDALVSVWDAKTQTKIYSLVGHTQPVWSVTFSPDSTRIVSGQASQGRDEGVLKVWNTETGEEELSILGHSYAVSGVQFSPDGTRIVSGSWDNRVKVWDADSGMKLVNADAGGWVNDIAISPSGTRIAAACDRGVVKIFDAESGRDVLTLEGHTREVDSVVWSHDGRKIVSGSRDGTVRIWDARNLKRDN